MLRKGKKENSPEGGRVGGGGGGGFRELGRVKETGGFWGGRKRDKAAQRKRPTSCRKVDPLVRVTPISSPGLRI